jgi:Transcriptional Coactivator p15 (PC4)
MSEQMEEKTDTKKRKVDADEKEAAGEATAPTVKLNDDGEAYFELAPMRRLTLRTFKGTVLVDIREVR